MAYVTSFTSDTGPDGSSDFFADYISSQSKRFQDWTSSILPEGYWINYGNVYHGMVANGKLLFRSKFVENNVLNVTQIWIDQSAREEFLTNVNSDIFNENITIPTIYSNYEATEEEVISLIADINSKANVVIQVCAEPYRISGMVIGDPLKASPIFTVP